MAEVMRRHQRDEISLMRLYGASLEEIHSKAWPNEKFDQVKAEVLVAKCHMDSYYEMVALARNKQCLAVIKALGHG